MGGEHNQVLWRGVQPVHGIRGVWPAIGAVRVVKAATAFGVEVNIAYTVPVGKILFISGCYLTSRNSGAVGKRAVFAVRDGGDVFFINLLIHFYDVEGNASDSQNFRPALEVPAGYDVYIDSDDALIDANGSVNGWIENA